MEQSTIQVNWITTLNCYFVAAQGARRASSKFALFFKIKIIFFFTSVPATRRNIWSSLKCRIDSYPISQRRLENIASYFAEKLLFVSKCIWNFLDAVWFLWRFIVISRARAFDISIFSLMINFFVCRVDYLDSPSFAPHPHISHLPSRFCFNFFIKNDTNRVHDFKGKAALFIFTICRHIFRWNPANIKHDFNM